MSDKAAEGQRYLHCVSPVLILGGLQLLGSTMLWRTTSMICSAACGVSFNLEISTMRPMLMGKLLPELGVRDRLPSMDDLVLPFVAL